MLHKTHKNAISRGRYEIKRTRYVKKHKDFYRERRSKWKFENEDRFNNCCCYCGRKLPLRLEHYIAVVIS